jgi:hypothetical protein
MKRKFCVVTTPRSYSTVVCQKLVDVMGPAIRMPGPPNVGYELLHYRYIDEVAQLYGLPLNDDDRQFIDAWFDWEPPDDRPLLRRKLSLAKRLLTRRPFFVGFKTFPQFHRYNEFFERRDVTFIVLHRRNLDIAFLSWCVALHRENFGDTFNAKLGDLTFAKLARNERGLKNLMKDFLFNLRGLSGLLSRGAIDLVVDENERVVSSPRLDAFFGRTIDFSDITHRSDYTALPDMDLFQQRFRELLTFWRSKSSNACSLVEEFESAYAARGG